MGRKSRHYRDESDPLLGFYSQTLQKAGAVATSAVTLSSSSSSSSSSEHHKIPVYSQMEGQSSPSYLPTAFSSNNNTVEHVASGNAGSTAATAASCYFNHHHHHHGTALPANTTTTTTTSGGNYADSGGSATGSYSQQPLLSMNHHHGSSLRNSVSSCREGGGGGVQNTSSNRTTTTTTTTSRTKEKTKKKNGYRIHRVSYTAQNHVQVLFQMYGSAFPNVLPFAIVNMIWTCTVAYLKRNNVVDLTLHSSIGHSFMGLLVSFLIVSRSKISYDRFMEFRRHLATAYRTCREIAQATTVYTFATQTVAARAWRQEVCFRTILLLRVTMDALLWSSMERDQWEEEYFSLQEVMENEQGCGDKQKKMDNDNGDHDDDEEGQQAATPASAVSEHFFRFRKLSHGRRSRIDENFRAPITLGHVLKQTIMEHPTALGHKMEVNEYRDVVNFVTIFLDAFHGFRVLIFTPYPFPLVQMTRAFLFFWVYTLPLVLLKDYRLLSALVIVCLVSFGFIGIEYVSMALDDPFGDDTNDVDEHGMALLVYEDIYLALYRTDGPASAFELRDRVLAQYKQGRGLDCYRDDLKGFSFWEPPHLQALAAQAQPVPRPSRSSNYIKNRKLDTISNLADPA